MTFLFSGTSAVKESVTANVGENVSLACTVDFRILSDAHIAWKAGDAVINTNEEKYSMSVKDGTSYLAISGISLEDRGNYTCEVRQSSVSSCELKVFVLAPPTAVILTDSSNKILHNQDELVQEINGMFSLSCCTVGSGSYPKTQIEWFFHETLTSVEILKEFDESNFPMISSCSNVTFLPTREHRDWIICAAFHEGLRRPLYTRVTLVAKGFTIRLLEAEGRNSLINGSTVYLSLSNTFSLICRFEDCGENTSLSWYLDGQFVEPNNLKFGPVWLTNEERFKSIVTFGSPTAALKEAIIMCRGVCGFHTKEISVLLNIQPLPILQLPDQHLVEFQPTFISCFLNDSSQDYVLRWIIGDKDVTSNATQRLTESGGSWISTLSFWPLKEYNGKPISCTLGNDPSRYRTVAMNIVYGAVILNIGVTPSQLVDENSDVNITCDVQSNPIHENVVQWEKFVNGNSRRWIRIRQANVLIVKSTTWYRWVLQLVNVERSQVGFYRCTATNGFGRFSESDPVHLHFNEMGICLDNDVEFVENEPTTIECLIKRRTPISVIRWLINNEEDVTRNATSEDVIDDTGRTVTQSLLQFYPLRKFNGKFLTCTSGEEGYAGDRIILNISYCPDQVTFSECTSVNDVEETTLTCESDISNPPVNLEFSGSDVTNEVYVTKINRSKYTGYISSVSARTKLDGVPGVLSNITCCSTTNRCAKVCDVCASMVTKQQDNLGYVLALLSSAIFLLVAVVVLIRFYCLQRQGTRDFGLELPETNISGRTRIENRSLQQQNFGQEYANSSINSSEAIYEHMKDRTTYFNEPGGEISGQTTLALWNRLLAKQTNIFDTVDISKDTYNISSGLERATEYENSTTYSCDVGSFTGLCHKHLSTTYTTEVGQSVRCELTTTKQIFKSGWYSYNAALISRENIKMKVFVKLFSDTTSMSSKNIFFEEASALETLEYHENIIQILGMCSASAPYCFLFEFLNETLHEKLATVCHSSTQHHEERDTTHSCLMKYSYDVANGMEYLTQRNFTCPRLICQNIFLDDGNNCKLHDFTLRETYTSELRENEEHETVTVAPEFHHKSIYTVKTDVWNYGQLLSQICSYDEAIFSPKSEIAIFEVAEWSTTLDSHLCTYLPKIFSLISSCCESSPDNRPSFNTILETLRRLDKCLLTSNS